MGVPISFAKCATAGIECGFGVGELAGESRAEEEIGVDAQGNRKQGQGGCHCAAATGNTVAGSEPGRCDIESD